MRAVEIQTFGDPSGMRVVQVPDAVPGQGQVVVNVEAIGVGGVDAVIRRGTLGGYGFRERLIPGSEVAGVVSAVGPGVDSSWVGRRVWAFTGTGGGYVEHAIVRSLDITPLPDGLSSVDSVTLGSAATVAHHALAHAHFASGESVLVRGAAGSIGIAAVELARASGASAVAVTTSSAARGRRLNEFGATHVFGRDGGPDHAHPSGSRRLDRADGSEPLLFDVIIDIVGGHELPDFLDRLAPNGRLVSVGLVAGMPPADFGMRLLQAFQQSRSFATFSLDTVPLALKNAARAELFVAAVQGELHAVVHGVLPLDRAADAHRMMDRGEVFGRVVLVP